jgi:hypothetical protein
MTRGTPTVRGYRAILAAAVVFGAGVLVGQNDTQPVPVPVAQSAPAPASAETSDQPAAAVPTDAPVANLIALRSMAPSDQARFLSRMTDPQLTALQAVAVTTPNVLPQANDEALTRGLPEVVAGGTDSFGAVQAVPVDPGPGILVAPTSPAPDNTPAPPPAPQVSIPCDGCETIST